MKYLLTALFLLSSILGADSQPYSKYHIVQLDYNINCTCNFPLRQAKGTIKYNYDAIGNLSSVKTFDKYDLNNVQKYDFERSTNKVISKHLNFVGNITLDVQGRITEASFLSSTGEYNTTYPYFYKFKYSADGYLIRITSYYDKAYNNNNTKLHDIYQLNYEDGNLVSITNVYNEEQEGIDKSANYELTYYDTPAIPDWNFAFGYYLNIHNNETQNMFIYALPNHLFGKQSKNLVKSVTQTYSDRSYRSTEHVDYLFNSDGLASQITISQIVGVDFKPTFNITYKKSN